MGYAIGSLTKGAGDDCHYQMLSTIKTLAEANGWTTLRFVNTGSARELILTSAGLSGTEEIFVGMKTYESIASDYYNIMFGTMVGYVEGNSFETQPGIFISGCPAHNLAMDYFISCNAQRIVGAFKVGTPVYEHFYIGKFLPYARPAEYPSPLICASMFNGAEAKRFSDTVQQMPYAGEGTSQDTRYWLKIRNSAGAWVSAFKHPFCFYFQGSYYFGKNLRPSDVDSEHYNLEPIVMYEYSQNLSPKSVYGELDGVFQITGFGNSVENVLQEGGSSIVDQTGLTVAQAVAAILAVGGKAFVVIQNVFRTGFGDYIAIEMS